MILDVQKILFPKKDLYLRIKYEVHEVWPNPLFMFFITFTMSVQFRESSKHIWPNKIQISLVLDIYFIYVKSHFKMLYFLFQSYCLVRCMQRHNFSTFINLLNSKQIQIFRLRSYSGKFSEYTTTKLYCHQKSQQPKCSYPVSILKLLYLQDSVKKFTALKNFRKKIFYWTKLFVITLHCF